MIKYNCIYNKLQDVRVRIRRTRFAGFRINTMNTAKVGILLLGRDIGATIDTIGVSQLKCVIFIQLQLQPLLVIQHYAMNSVKLAF